MISLARRCVAEALGTFAFIFIGCGAAVTSILPGGSPGLMGIALAHALVLSVMITATMNISGGHLNPAVTLGLLSVRRIAPIDAAAYVGSQLVGAVFGAFLLSRIFPPGVISAVTLGTPSLATGMSLASGIALEAVLTFFLVSAVFGTAISANAPKVGGFAIGLVLCFDMLVGGPLTGAAMNPARAFGPALISGTWYAQLVWWVGPIVGGILAAQLWHHVLLNREP
ncbi:MAG: aquaporin [Gemmatimonadales bacterium]